MTVAIWLSGSGPGLRVTFGMGLLWGDRARIITVQDAFDQKQQRLLSRRGGASRHCGREVHADGQGLNHLQPRARAISPAPLQLLGLDSLLLDLSYLNLPLIQVLVDDPEYLRDLVLGRS